MFCAATVRESIVASSVTGMRGFGCGGRRRGEGIRGAVGRRGERGGETGRGCVARSTYIDIVGRRVTVALELRAAITFGG
jgi:hypothetical protein